MLHSQRLAKVNTRWVLFFFVLSTRPSFLFGGLPRGVTLRGQQLFLSVQRLALPGQPGAGA